MKITQEEVVDNQTTLHIELEDDDLGPYLDRGYRRIAHQVSVPGFRKGKAPRSIVEGTLGRENILNEVLDVMVGETIVRAVEQLGLESLGLPRVDNVEFDPVQFTAVVPLSPEIDLGDYESIRVEYDEPEVTDEEVTQRIDSIRESMGTWETVERPPQFGDLATIDMSSDVEGESPWQAEDDTFYMAEDGSYPLPEFSHRLVDAEIGQPIEFTLEVPEDNRDASIAGKEASFSVTVKDVRERTLPELTDEWVQGLPDNYETVEALTAAVRDALAANTEAAFRAEYRNRAIEALVNGAELLIAPVIVQTETERIREEQAQSLRRANIQLGDYLAAMGKTEEEAELEAEEEAEQRVRRNIVVSRLAEIEGIESTVQEVDERFNQLFGGQRMRRQQRRAAHEELASSIKIEKTLDFLVAIARGERDTEASAEEGGELVQNGAAVAVVSADEGDELDQGGAAVAAASAEEGDEHEQSDVAVAVAGADEGDEHVQNGAAVAGASAEEGDEHEQSDAADAVASADEGDEHEQSDVAVAQASADEGDEHEHEQSDVADAEGGPAHDDSHA